MKKAENRLGSIVAAALDAVVVHVTSEDHAEADLLVQPREGNPFSLQVRWAGEGWPDDVRRVAADLPHPWPPQLVILARRFSPGAIEWLRQREANWADEAGQARIVGPSGIIVIREPKFGASERPEFRWSPSAIGVAEAILTRLHEPIHVPQIAQISDWSDPQVAAVMKRFDEHGWTAKRGPARGRGAHRVPEDVYGLLANFAGALAEERRVARLAHRATDDVMALLQDHLRQPLEEHVRWALTGWAGLELAAPIMTAVPTLHIYVAENDFAGALSTVIEESGLREVSEGARVTFWRTNPQTLALSSRHRNLPVVSAPRLYGDLSSFGPRGQDAADHVRRELMGL